MITTKLKTAIIDDLKVGISYIPNKETDLLCMMKQYTESSEKRKTLQVEMNNLLNDKPYNNPFMAYYFYTEKDIEELDNILTSYISAMVDKQILSHTIMQINELHDKCMGELIDKYRKKKLEELLVIVGETAELSEVYSVIASEKRW